MEKETTIEGVIERFKEKFDTFQLGEKVLRFEGDKAIMRGRLDDKDMIDFLRSALSAQKEEIENNIVKMKKTDLDLSPGFSITAEYRLGEIRGWNNAIESIISSITNNKEKK